MLNLIKTSQPCFLLSTVLICWIVSTNGTCQWPLQGTSWHLLMSTSALRSGFAWMPMWDSVFNTSQWFVSEMDSETESFSHGITPVKHILLKKTKEKQNTMKCVKCHCWCSHMPFCRVKWSLYTSIDPSAGVLNLLKLSLKLKLKKSSQERIQCSGVQINWSISLMVE